MTRVIGFCGPEGAGKSSAALILGECYGAAILPFAEPMKRMLLTLGIDERHLYGTTDDKLASLDILGGKSARHAMKSLGSEWGRAHIDVDLWVRAWRTRATKTESGMLTVDDVRLPNEVAAVRALGGSMICVVRSLEDFKRVPTHDTEDFASIKADWILINDGTLESLRAKILALFGTSELPLCLVRKDDGHAPAISPVVRAKATLSALNDSFQRNAHRMGFIG